MLPDEFRFFRAEPRPPLHSAIREAWQRAIYSLEVNPSAELPFKNSIVTLEPPLRR